MKPYPELYYIKKGIQDILSGRLKPSKHTSAEFAIKQGVSADRRLGISYLTGPNIGGHPNCIFSNFKNGPAFRVHFKEEKFNLRLVYFLYINNVIIT